MLETLIKQYAQLGAGYYRFLQAHGRLWTPQPLPEDIAPGPKKACFETAGRLALEDDSFTYVEGIAFNLFPTAHAWVVREDGLVIDPTWDNPETCQYFGLAFTRDYLFETIERNKVWGIAPEMVPHDLVENPGAALHPVWHPDADDPLKKAFYAPPSRRHGN